MSQVVVEGLKWVKHPTADLWRADNLLGRYQVYAVINIVSWAFDAHDGLTRSSGDAASVDEAKAAAQKDYEARIRSTLADPIPEAPADEEDPRWQKLRDLLGLDGWHDGMWQGIANPDQIVTHVEHIASERFRLLRRSTETDKPVEPLSEGEIAKLIKQHFPWQSHPKAMEALTYEKSPPLFPQATYDVPKGTTVNFVRAIEARYSSAAETDKPGVREAALEEAAKVAETITQDGDYDLEPEATVAASVAGKQIAAAIRALRTSPPASPTEAGEAGK